MLLLFTALAVAMVVGVGASYNGRHPMPSLMIRRHRCLHCGEEALRWVRLERAASGNPSGARSPSGTVSGHYAGYSDELHGSDYWVVYVCERCDAGFVYYDERWLTTEEFARLGPQ